MLPAKLEAMPGHGRVAPGGNKWLAFGRPHHPARVLIRTAVAVPSDHCGMPSGSRNAIGPVPRHGGRPSSAASDHGGRPGIVNSRSPAAPGIESQPGTSAAAWSSCAPLTRPTGIRRGSSSGAGPRRARRILSGQAGERAALTPAEGVRVVQAVAWRCHRGCHPDRRVVTKTWAFRGERARRVKARCSFLPRAGSVAASRPPLRQRPAGTPLLRGLRGANRRRSGQA
jgi:hypothetical protein